MKVWIKTRVYSWKKAFKSKSSVQIIIYTMGDLRKDNGVGLNNISVFQIAPSLGLQK